MRPRRLRFLPLPLTALCAALAVTAGCEEPRQVNGKAPAKAVPPKDNFIVGKRTQQIGRFDAQEEAKKGGQLANMKIVAKDPITLQGNAYVTAIGRTSMMQIEHALNLYRATNDRFPANYDEFMSEIIKANNIALPALPFYQEYKYDEKEHKLIVIEYPDKKAGPLPQ
jgi:hypothetical protein